MKTILILFALTALAYGKPQNYGNYAYGNLMPTFEKQMNKLQQDIANMQKNLPHTNSKIEGNEYSVTMAMKNIEENDITVKVKGGELDIEAKHKNQNGGIDTLYSIRNNLPSNIDLNGSWTFLNGTIKVVFPLKDTKGNGTTGHPVEIVKQ